MRVAAEEVGTRGGPRRAVTSRCEDLSLHPEQGWGRQGPCTAAAVSIPGGRSPHRPCVGSTLALFKSSADGVTGAAGGKVSGAHTKGPGYLVSRTRDLSAVWETLGARHWKEAAPRG